jgi:hypothetical protein
MVHDFSVHLDLDPGSASFGIFAKCLEGEERGSLALRDLKQIYDEQAWLATKEGAKATRKEAVDKGGRLFEALMGGGVRKLFRRATQAVWGGGHRLRLILESAATPGLPAWVHALLWELMYDPDRGRFLAIDPDILLVRYLRQPNPIATFPSESPLRVLATSACPEDKTCPPLALTQEIDHLDQMFMWPQMQGRVEATSHPDIRFNELQRELIGACRAEQPFHVWHHCGHGRFSKEEGEYQLAFEDSAPDAGGGLWIGARKLADLLGNCGDLGLVFLNVCLGAYPDGLGAMLAGLGVPAVIGYTVRVEDRVALQFSREFWRAFATEPVDAAVQRARQLLAGSHDQLAFAHAVLFLRSRNGLPAPVPGG